jgi:voltage-gated potassium channel
MARSQEAYERFERRAEVPMLLLSLAFLPVIIVPAATDLSPGATAAFRVAAALIWLAFVVEFVVLLRLAPDRREMVRTHLFDLAVIVLPFLRPLRAARSIPALLVLGRAFSGVRAVTARRGFRSFVGAAVAMVVAGGFVTWLVERNRPGATIVHVGDALWWAIVTTTTVGYGDRVPVSPAGRVVAVLLMVVGIGLLSVVTANVAAYLVEGGSEEDAGLHEIQHQLARIEAAQAEQRAALDALLQQLQRPQT